MVFEVLIVMWWWGCYGLIEVRDRLCCGLNEELGWLDCVFWGSEYW